MGSTTDDETQTILDYNLGPKRACKVLAVSAFASLIIPANDLNVGLAASSGHIHQ